MLYLRMNWEKHLLGNKDSYPAEELLLKIDNVFAANQENFDEVISLLN